MAYLFILKLIGCSFENLGFNDGRISTKTKVIFLSSIEGFQVYTLETLLAIPIFEENI